MCYEKMTDLASVIEVFYVHYLIFWKQYKTNVQKERKRKNKILGRWDVVFYKVFFSPNLLVMKKRKIERNKRFSVQ